MKKYFILSITWLSLIAVSAFCQQSAPQPTVTVYQLSPTIYKLVCNFNIEVNATASIGEDGILLVDTGLDGTSELLQAELKRLSDKEVKYIINTHYHYDHTGGNRRLANNATVIAHENVKKRLSSGVNILFDITGNALPGRFVENELTLHFNGEDIRVIHLPGGHTDGDVIVHFTKSNIVSMGDLLFSDRFPFVDRTNGGHLKNYADNIQQVIEMFPENTKFIAGHGRDYTIDDLKNYLTMMNTTTALVQAEINANKSVDDLMNNDLLKDWNSWGTGFIDQNAWIDLIYNELSGNTVVDKTSIIDPLINTINEKGVQAAISQYYDLKKNNADYFDFSEPHLNALGYYLMNKNRIQEAIEIFKLNVEAFPEAWNVYDSLGEAYMKNDQKELAIQNYEKSLQLNPENTNALEILKKLKN